mmetsp:Transcript_15651/g.23709  ORF Transcript_15651/g.23709 Transcript_15651/m.23709 type:complete len:251 (+) Transcript_15651:67-819(+)
MKTFNLQLLTLLCCIHHSGAFLINPQFSRVVVPARKHCSSSKLPLSAANKKDDRLTHETIVWKLRPAETTGWVKKIILRLAAKAIRLDCLFKKQDPPFALCPKGGQAVLEAHLVGEGKVARFGFSTIRGPPVPLIDESAEDLFGIKLEGRSVGSAAIIYMYVEPPQRKLGIGEMALEIISCIHAMQGCDFTLLVADDDGSGKLVSWYEKNKYKRAPKLQNLLGSPNEEYGVTMMAPSQQRVPENCVLKWW